MADDATRENLTVDGEAKPGAETEATLSATDEVVKEHGTLAAFRAARKAEADAEPTAEPTAEETAAAEENTEAETEAAAETEEEDAGEETAEETAKETAGEETEEATAEAVTEEETGGEKPKPKPKKRTRDGRINVLTKTVNELRIELATERRLREQFQADNRLHRAGAAGGEPRRREPIAVDTTGMPEVPPKPKSEDFENPDEFTDALLEHKLKTRDNNAELQRRKRAAEATETARAASSRDRAARFDAHADAVQNRIAADPDAANTFQAGKGIRVTDAISHGIVHAPNSVDLQLHLLKNKATRDRLMAIEDPNEQYMETRYEGRRIQDADATGTETGGETDTEPKTVAKRTVLTRPSKLKAPRKPISGTRTEAPVGDKPRTTSLADFRRDRKRMAQVRGAA